MFGELAEEPCLLSAAERQGLLSVHHTLLHDCSRAGKLDPTLVSSCEAMGRVVAEVDATSSKNRRQAAKCAAGNYRGV